MESNFCIKCEQINKSGGNRETYYEGLLCPNCNTPKSRNIDKEIKEILEKAAVYSANLYKENK